MIVDLFAVQPYMDAEDYFSKEAFYHKIERYFKAAQQQRETGRPAVIVFPEDLATFLLMEGRATLLSDMHTMNDAFAAIGNAQKWAILWSMLRFHTVSSKRAFFAHGAAHVWHIWHGTMSRLAHDYQMTVVAGSALLPESRWNYDLNTYRARNNRIYNLSFTVSPLGHVVYHTRKVNLVPTQEDQLDLSPGSLKKALALHTLTDTNISMATAICYDAFARPHTNAEPHFVNVLEALDRSGARLVAQPSANPWWWNDLWPLDERRIRREQWDEDGSLTSLASCRNVEVIVNPQLLLNFLDLHFDGESRILARVENTVEVLVRSQGIQGPEADQVLHSSWNFKDLTSPSDEKPKRRSLLFYPNQLVARGAHKGTKIIT